MATKTFIHYSWQEKGKGAPVLNVTCPMQSLL